MRPEVLIAGMARSHTRELVGAGHAREKQYRGVAAWLI